MFIIVFPLDICFWRALGELNMDGESEIRSVEDLEAKLADVMLPFDEIVPVAAKEWLEKVATSHGTSREMFLLSALTSTSALIGKSTLQVFSTYGEKGNLFTVVIAPSGSGKTPACHLGTGQEVAKTELFEARAARHHARQHAGPAGPNLTDLNLPVVRANYVCSENSNMEQPVS